ncbi:hypothetical protein SDC9_153435 [bioreactor metagenome]|uniref:Uncharacterized protein n=1 Tax=bioreactor metagenome TaxID=1076179 RepID=A0A645EYC8_9ZZZZ
MLDRGDLLLNLRFRQRRVVVPHGILAPEQREHRIHLILRKIHTARSHHRDRPRLRHRHARIDRERYNTVLRLILTDFRRAQPLAEIRGALHRRFAGSRLHHLRGVQGYGFERCADCAIAAASQRQKQAGRANPA